MRFARRALFAALATTLLVSAAAAQALRPENDPRNQAPTVGTGGTPGGPTGLFTIYDGDTLRRGEYTFSVAYSNYDRDPGNVDIVAVPVSFNIGLGDHAELFFSTEAYRGVKVNNPRNLSGFYLPNSQLFFGPTLLRNPAAIILAPERVSGPTVGGGAVFRPAGTQPFVGFPFVGGAGTNLGLTGNVIAPPFVSRIGAAQDNDGGNWGAAANFPGVGSPCGSILPGVVLTTRTIPANLTFNTLTVPDLFTTCPTYIADAPFVNRLYGESSFGTMNVGGKFRFTEPDNPLGVGLVAFYRFYLDKADDESGFNQLQRGASPGGDFGDIGVGGFISGRLSRSVNLSVNATYVLNSNPKSDQLGADEAVLLDRPDELITGIGFDFPVNRHFQPIAELKSVWYTGGRTPNAFENNPVDFLVGVRVYPRRWFGFSAWYRAHLNQQGDRILNDAEFPAGFQPSRDPHGFGFQFFAGRRNERCSDTRPPYCIEEKVDYKVNLSSTSGSVELPNRECRGCTRLKPDCPQGTSPTVTLSADIPEAIVERRDLTSSTEWKRTTFKPTPDELRTDFTWKWTVDGPGPVGGGYESAAQSATLDFSGSPAGTYRVRLTANYLCFGGTCEQYAETTVNVTRPDCCLPITPPNVSVNGPTECVPEKEPVSFTANLSGVEAGITPTYNWTVSPGTIIGGQGTQTISVDTAGVAPGQTITARVVIGGYPSECPVVAAEAPATICGVTEQECDIFDRYPDLRFNDEKARLDNLAIRLQEDQSATGYYVYYNGPGRSGNVVGAARAERALRYLEAQRNIRTSGDSPRVRAIDGGYRDQCFAVILFVCRAGDKQPPPTAQDDQRVVEALRDVDAECVRGPSTRPRPRPRPRPRRKRQRVVLGSE